MKDIFYLFLYYPQIMCLIFVPKKWSLKYYSIKKINFFILKYYIYVCVHYWRKFMNKFFIFSFGQFIKKIWIIKFEIMCNDWMKYGLNKINTKLFTQQVGWLGGKRVQFCPWGPRIKLHKWHYWATMEYCLNIPHLIRLPWLGA